MSKCAKINVSKLIIAMCKRKYFHLFLSSAGNSRHFMGSYMCEYFFHAQINVLVTYVLRFIAVMSINTYSYWRAMSR